MAPFHFGASRMDDLSPVFPRSRCSKWIWADSQPHSENTFLDWTSLQPAPRTLGKIVQWVEDSYCILNIWQRRVNENHSKGKKLHVWAQYAGTGDSGFPWKRVLLPPRCKDWPTWRASSNRPPFPLPKRPPPVIQKLSPTPWKPSSEGDDSYRQRH